MKICPVCSTEYPDDIRFCQNDGTTLRAAAPAANLVGQVIADRYHVVKKLGEGGMGQVYLAEHVKMGRRSAIKVMNPSLTHDADAVARFNREAANASRITHPNVCAVYDFGETPDGLIYLAMEFVEGEPLTDLLGRDGALSLARATRIFQQVADALHAAHDLGIVHRDLKPDNIMLTKGRDGADVVKVVDFGIAKAVGGEDAGQKVTKTGMVVGTPEFMSPEQLSGDKLDGRSDLYSLALVFFRMLTGKLPFEATTVQETMVKRLTDEPMKLAVVRSDLAFPPGLQEVMDAALTRSPVDRYQSAAKFATDVASVVGVARGPVIPATRGDAESKTHLLEKPLPLTAARKSAPGATRKRSPVPIVVGAVVVLGGGGAAVALLGGHKANGNAVRPDTANRIVANQRDSARQDARQPTNRSSVGTRTGAPVSSLTGAGHPSLDIAAARRALEDLRDKLLDEKLSPAATRDSALRFYYAAAVPQLDRAFAAQLVTQTYLQQDNRDKAYEWALNASRYAPNDTGYASLVRQLRPQN
ncbi:MAG: hypothetical protein AUH42_05760 [Gemmatimonadetes bacterium 13_1_40CM_70_11]|nr:MAG: hypothetical protein AUH42_05760 [Gemmatimonadetes bacterium 13_1_40CM_70_11]